MIKANQASKQIKELLRDSSLKNYIFVKDVVCLPCFRFVLDYFTDDITNLLLQHTYGVNLNFAFTLKGTNTHPNTCSHMGQTFAN